MDKERQEYVLRMHWMDKIFCVVKTLVLLWVLLGFYVLYLYRGAGILKSAQQLDDTDYYLLLFSFAVLEVSFLYGIARQIRLTGWISTQFVISHDGITQRFSASKN